jgi:hypothetical protein
MTNKTRFFAVAALASALFSAGARPAWADEPAEPASEATPPAAAPPLEPIHAAAVPLDYTSRALTPAQGRVAVHGDLLVNLSKNVVAKPIVIVPAVLYGLSDAMAVGVMTNVFYETWGFSNGVSGTPGLCVGGTDRGCEKAFNNVSLDALYVFMHQPGTQVAAHFGVDVLRLSDPSQLGVHAGIQAKLTGGPLSVLMDPSVIVGVTKRDELLEQVIVVPLRVGFQASSDLNVGLVTGVAGSTNHFSDDYVIPVGITGVFSPAANMDLGAHFTFPNLVGNNHSSEGRVLGLVFNYRT